MDPILLVRRELMGNYEFGFASKYFDVVESRVECRSRLVVGRYSVLPFYNELDRDLQLLGSRLINTLAGHRWIANFEYYDSVRQHTPATWNEGNFHQCRSSGPFVVKGKTKSRKWQWKSRMFAPTKRGALELAERLREETDLADEGVIFRQFVPLRVFGEGKEGLPFTNEWRFFFLRTQCLGYAYYWSMTDFAARASISPAAIRLAHDIAAVVAPNVLFFTLDLAETETGNWILIEINDGQISVPTEHDLDQLYGNLRMAIDRGGLEA